MVSKKCSSFEILFLDFLRFWRNFAISVTKAWAQDGYNCAFCAIANNASIVPLSPWGGGWGVLNKVLYREGSPVRSNPLPFYMLFWQWWFPFRISSIDKCHPFHRPSFKLWIPFKCSINALFKEYEWATKVILQTKMTDFPTLSCTSTSENPALPYTWSLKKVPLSGGASPYRPSPRKRWN